MLEKKSVHFIKITKAFVSSGLYDKESQTFVLHYKKINTDFRTVEKKKLLIINFAAFSISIPLRPPDR